MVVTHKGARTVNLSTYGAALRLRAAKPPGYIASLSSSLLNCGSAFATC